jgi:hypothetical protein
MIAAPDLEESWQLLHRADVSWRLCCCCPATVRSGAQQPTIRPPAPP